MRKSTIITAVVVACTWVPTGISPAFGGFVDGTIIRSFPSPLGVGTHGVAMDLDGEHLWINNRDGSFTQIDLFGNEIPGTRGTTPSTLPQGFEMDSAGDLWLIDRSTNSERAMRMDTSGALLSSFLLNTNLGNLDNPNDLTMKSGDLYIAAPNDPAMHRFQSNGAFVETIALSPPIDPAYPFNEAIAYDGKYFWLAFGNSVPTPASKVYKVASDGTVLSSFLFETRIAGLSYGGEIIPNGFDEVILGPGLSATNGYVSDTIYLIAIPEPATALLTALGMLIAFRNRRMCRGV